MNGRTLKKWLLEKYEHADARIKAGDLDLDDRLHTVRTATGELLRILLQHRPPEQRMTAIDNAFNEWFNEDVQDDIRSLIFRAFKAGFEDGMREGMLIVMNTEAGKKDYS